MPTNKNNTANIKQINTIAENYIKRFLSVLIVLLFSLVSLCVLPVGASSGGVDVGVFFDMIDTMISGGELFLDTYTAISEQGANNAVRKYYEIRAPS